MTNDPEQEKILKKLDELNERAEVIRKRSRVDNGTDYESLYDEGHEKRSQYASQAGSEFLASVLGGAILGYGIDWFFNTLPWGMIAFIILGFVSGVYRANESMKKNEEKQ